MAAAGASELGGRRGRRGRCASVRCAERQVFVARSRRIYARVCQSVVMSPPMRDGADSMLRAPSCAVAQRGHRVFRVGRREGAMVMALDRALVRVGRCICGSARAMKYEG